MGKYIIWDMDGTLLDSLTDLQNTLNYCFKKEGFPERSYQEVRTFVGNGLRTLIERAVPKETSDKKVESILLPCNKAFTVFIRYSLNTHQILSISEIKAFTISSSLTL